MYSISLLDKHYHSRAFDFVCRQFVSESPLHRATGVIYEEYVDYLREPFATLVTAGMSFIATEEQTGDLIGCLVAADYTAPQQNDAPVPDSIKPIKQLLLDLESSYERERKILPGDIALVDTAVVAPSARKQGVYNSLRQTVHAVASDRGYRGIVGELSSAATQNYCVQKLGHRVVSEIDFQSFCYAGSYPFRSIQEPASIQLVEAALSPLTG